MKNLSVKDSVFKKTLFAQVAPELNIEEVFSSSYYPRGYGHVEIFTTW